MTTIVPRRALLFGLLLFPGLLSAEPAWISDQFEVTLRSGPSTANAIERMLTSGTRLEVLERDAGTGYARVRTAGGTEGYVLLRYLMDEPPAREQLQELTSQLTDAATRGSSLGSQLAAVRAEHEAATRRIAELERENAALSEQLAGIRRTAADVLAINEQNRSLQQQLAASEIRVAALEQENRDLESQSTRYWFATGAGVLVAGIILGLWLPRIRRQRRSRYERF